MVRTLLFGNPVPGYPSLMTVVLFLGGVQLMTLGVIGEYLGRIFNETKRRPLYLVERYSPSEHRPGEFVSSGSAPCDLTRKTENDSRISIYLSISPYRLIFGLTPHEWFT